ncbi:MAG TPA: hypothetical protein VGA03_05300 [Anaerolineales bacterium]
MRRKAIYLFISAALLASCTLPAPASPTPVDQEAVFTSAAETILARLTQSGPTSTTREPAVQTPLVTDPAEITSTPPAGASTPTPEPSPEPGPSATSTVTETQAASDSPTPTLTSTALPSDPRARFGNPDFSDTFTSGENWALFEDEHVSFEVASNRLLMTAFNPDSWDSWMLSWPSLEDFYIEMTATQERCSGLDRFGMMLRATRTGKGYVGYLMGAACDGRYSLRRWNGDKFVTLIDWTASDRLNAGSDQTNRIGLLAEGNRLGLYANGNLLEEISDDTHTEGRIGVFVGSVNTEDFTVQVDEVAFWELP